MAFNQKLTAIDIAPRAQSFADATLPQRRAYYRKMRSAVERHHRQQLLQGRRGYGANGKPFPARKRPRADRANGPVLSPHKGHSRTFRLLTSSAHDNGITSWWHHGAGSSGRMPWGDVLAAHAAGEVKGAPARDARMSAKTIREIQREGETLWRSMVRDTNARRKIRNARLLEQQRTGKPIKPRKPPRPPQPNPLDQPLRLPPLAADQRPRFRAKPFGE